MSVLDKLHAALAEEKRIEGLRGQAEAAVRPSLLLPSLATHFPLCALAYELTRACFQTIQRSKPKPAKMAFKSNTRDRRRDYARESLLASEESPRSIGADGSPILQVRSGLLKHSVAYMH